MFCCQQFQSRNIDDLVIVGVYDNDQGASKTYGSPESGRSTVLRPTQAIHTFWMQFAIDLVFVNRKNRVTKVVPALKPSRMAMSLWARGVIELPPGTAEATDTTAGDQLEFERAEAERPAAA